MSLLEVSDLEVAYGPARVLHGIDLTVEQGQVSVILGANGAGKTTILRALSGMVPTAGEIRFDGRSIAGHRSESIARRGIAHVPQGRGTFGNLTVEENLKAGGTRCSARHVRAAIERWYAFFPRLGERAHQQAAGLSGGEQQMLAIARALVAEPRLLLLDEPSLGLAPKITQGVFAGLAEINREHGTTILVVEQNAHLALDIGSVGTVIDAGTVVARGTASDLKSDEEVRRAYLGY
ncbi:MAG: ABC transporter ATP-binding protein [Aeromicrobium sp.]